MSQDSEQLREMFDHFDRDGNGAITTDELAELLRALGKSADPAEVAQLMASADLDGDGSIDFSELVSLAARWMRQPLNEADLRAADIDGDGVLDFEEFVRVVTASHG